MRATLVLGEEILAVEVIGIVALSGGMFPSPRFGNRARSGVCEDATGTTANTREDGIAVSHVAAVES